jgi:nucleoside-diphosphate-sugar epimerase
VQLAEVLMRASGRSVEVEHAPARPGELQHSSLDATKLRALGWEPRTGVQEGLAETFRWIEANPHHSAAV